MRLNIYHSKRIVLWFSLLVILTGCLGDDLDDVRQYVQEVKSRSAAPIDPLPEVKSYQTITYAAFDKRSPFKMPEVPIEIVAGSSNGILPDINRPKEPLERFSLDSLNMVGTLNMYEAMWAIILDKDGVIHRVSQGDYLGQNFGNIKKVTEDRIDIVEIVPDNRGGWEKRDISLVIGD